MTESSAPFQRRNKVILTAEILEIKSTEAPGDTWQIGNVAVRLPDGSVNVGRGPLFIYEWLQYCTKHNSPLVTFHGLKVFQQACTELVASPEKARKVAKFALSNLHVDIAFDFAADNGYDVLWDSLGAITADTLSVEDAAAALHTLVQTSEDTGVMLRQTKAGKLHAWPLAGQLKSTQSAFRNVTVAAAVCRQYPPDQSWMTHDIKDPLAEVTWLQSIAFARC